MSLTDDASVDVYKIRSTDVTELSGLVSHASNFGGTNQGIRKPAGSMIMWVDTDNFSTPNAQILGWLQSLANEYGDTYQLGGSTPTVPYIQVAYDASFPPTNSSIYGIDHIITSGFAHYPLAAPAGVLWIEYYQARNDLEDVGGTDPPLVSLDGSGNPFLNKLGTFFKAALDLVYAKTKF